MKTIITNIPDLSTFYKGQKTLEIGYPWLTFGAIMALEKILRDSKGSFRILELGSGGSTIFFAKRCKKLITMEHNRNWAFMVSEKLLIGSPVIISCHSPTKLRERIKMLEDGYFDLVLVDNGSGAKTYVHRQKALDIVPPKLKKGGWLIIDNYERVTFDYTGWDVYTFDMFRYSGRGTKLCKKL